MTTSEGTETADAPLTLDALRAALGELFGAERRLRGREHQKDLPVTHSQLRALLVLDKEEKATAGSLARSADLNPASVTAMLDQLEASGIVTRQRSPEDRRVCMVSLTEAGREVVEARRARWHDLWEERLGDLTPEEMAGALRVMRAIAAMLDEI